MRVHRNARLTPLPVIPRFMRGTHSSAVGAERNGTLKPKLNPGSREHVAG